jgi:hypothetical protein
MPRETLWILTPFNLERIYTRVASNLKIIDAAGFWISNANPLQTLLAQRP